MPALVNPRVRLFALWAVVLLIAGGCTARGAGAPESLGLLFVVVLLSVLVGLGALATITVTIRWLWRLGRSRVLTPSGLKSAYLTLFGPADREPVDRFGQPLPWRWRRSLSRDLLGPYGLVVLGVAIAIKAVSYVPLVSPPAEAVPTAQPHGQLPSSGPYQDVPRDSTKH
jgi:hypothetical protein